ncbi:MAG: hypothetical protein H0W39_06715 [Sphingomonas sp.]|nr:hypothetical protein [Sphingomonas sp.]
MTVLVAQSTAHAMLDAIETDLGASPVLYLRSGTPPATLAAADTGTLISTIAMAADAFLSAAAWAKAITAALSDTSADAAGTLGHWRIKTSGGVSKLSGTITATGGGGDMTVDNVNVALGQQIDVTSFSIGFPVANQG